MLSGDPNVVLLTVDALRADRLSCHGYGRETSPVIDRLAREHTHFTDAYSASSFTREAIPALLTGQYPGAASNSDFGLVADSVATRLVGTAYVTAAFHSNPYVSRAYGFGHDFDTFDDDLRLGTNRLVVLLQRAFDRLRQHHYARAEAINERALAWLDARSGNEPFFLWNHYMDAHAPYEPPTEYRELFHDESVSTRAAWKLYWRAAVTNPESITDAERQTLSNLYSGEIRYIDAQIESFLAALDDRDILDDTVVIITADHGEAFGEHGYYGHPRELHDELVHVPLIALGPELPTARIGAPTSTIDVVPTVLDVADIDHDDFPGMSLFAVADNPERFADRCVFSSARREGEYSHRRRFSVRAVDDQCFLEGDIETGELDDPSVACDPALEVALREHATNRLAADEQGEIERSAPTTEVARRLDALGYQ